jgi:hypothetical protein
MEIDVNIVYVVVLGISGILSNLLGAWIIAENGACETGA